MAVPIQYNIRNLTLRKSATIMTALGIALTVTTAIFIMALLAGLNAAFKGSGDPLNVLVLRKGATAELSAGGVDRDSVPIMKELPGVARDAQGQALVSGEDLLVVVLPRNDGTGRDQRYGALPDTHRHCHASGSETGCGTMVHTGAARDCGEQVDS